MIVRKLRALLRIGREPRLDDLSLGKSLLRAVLRRLRIDIRTVE